MHWIHAFMLKSKIVSHFEVVRPFICLWGFFHQKGEDCTMPALSLAPRIIFIPLMYISYRKKSYI